MLRSGTLDPTSIRRGLEVIERNVRAQTQLIGDLLDVSRIIPGQLRLEVSPIGVVPVVEAGVEAVRPSAEAKEIALGLELAAELPAIMGDPDRLQQVVWNLVSNAVKFTPQCGRIDVRLRKEGSCLSLSVTDDGKGIEPEFLPHVFDRFRQADGTSTRRHGGLGLGLAIVRHLVELHGGTVHADSDGDGLGSTFTVRLPVRAVQVTARENERSTPVPAVSSTVDQPLLGVSVLAVDDEADARELIATVLEQAGARTITVSTAEEALEVLRHDRPDVLLSDIGIPGSDGYSLMRRVRDLPPERGGKLPAAALPAHSRPADARRGFEAGVHSDAA